MPCYAGSEPTLAQIEAGRVFLLAREALHGETFTRQQWRDACGNPGNLDGYTRDLCTWCKAHPDDVKRHSLELQIWWRDHQETDRQHEKEEEARRRQQAIKAQALAKLTPEERKALGHG